jgi:hypothetical protein
VSSAPFFIVGSGRSGTTLLRAILTSHSRLCIPPETWFLNRMGDLLGVDRSLAPDEVERAVTIMTTHYRWPDFQLDVAEFRRDVAGVASPHLRDIVEIVYRKHLERDHKVRWGDKTPGYIELVPQLVTLFPDASFIYFVRDGRDVAKSFQSRRWNGRWLHNNTREWNEAMEFYDRWNASPLSNRILEIHYEDLVLDPEKTIKKICAYLGERFEPEMLSWEKKVDQLVPDREAHIHEKLKQTPGPADIYRWKHEMSAREVLVSEAFMGDHLKAHGYELRFQGSLWKPVLWATRWYCEYALPVVGLPMRAVQFARRHLFAEPTSATQVNARTGS